MVFGRDTELSHLEVFLDRVSAGEGGSVLLHGEPGIGKTALATHVLERAAARGLRTLAIRGVESETEIAFGGLHDLLAPVLGNLRSLPEPLQVALRAAFALTLSSRGDRLATCAATQRLLAAAAAERPVVAIVDDLQWVDSASRECILYATRRVTGPLGVLLTTRDGRFRHQASWLGSLPLTALAPEVSRAWLAELAPDLAAPVAAAVAGAAAGNPLATLDLLASLEPAQRTGTASLPQVLHPSEQLSASYLARAAELPAATRSALLTAAAYDGGELRVLSAALEQLGAKVGDLAPAEGVDLIALGDGRVVFAHPLVRAALYHDAAGAERRRVHAALASVLGGEARAWHLAAAAIEPDEGVATEMEQAAHAALARGGPGPASGGFERAARLSPAPEDFARRALAAGDAAARAALPERALALFEEVASATADAATRAVAQHRHALTLYRRGQVAAARDLLAVVVARHDVGDQAREGISRAHLAAIWSDAAMAAVAAGDCRGSLRAAERAQELLEPSDPDELRAQVLAALGWALVLRGEGTRAAPVLADLDRTLGAIDPISDAGQSVAHSLNLRVWSGDLEALRDECLRVCARAQELGAVSVLPSRLLLVAESAFRTGDWDQAELAVRDALAASEDAGQPLWSAAASLLGGRLAAARGNEAHVRRVTPTVLELAEASGARGGIPMARAVLGFLELGLGHSAAAIAQLTLVAEFAQQSGLEEPTLFPWEADLVEAHLREAHTDEAAATLAGMGRRAQRAGTPMALGPYERCLGMHEPDYDARFGAALAYHDARPMPFERGRTLLAFGRRLHRARRRAEARRVLHEAAATFERLRAAPWLAQAEDELLAAGGRRRAAATDDTSLSPAERRVAEAVVRGLSNREVAAELFLSHKTVEFHLGHIYRKLGITSRTQLVTALPACDATSHVPPIP